MYNERIWEDLVTSYSIIYINIYIFNNMVYIMEKSIGNNIKLG